MYSVFEGSAFTRIGDFTDEDDDSYIPSTVEYSIVCQTNKRTITDWTSVTPAASVTFLLNEDVNNILNRANKKERKALNIRIDKGLSSAKVTVYEWDVKRIQDPDEPDLDEPGPQDGYNS